MHSHILYDCLFAGAKILVSFQIHFVSCNRYFTVNNKLCKNESFRPLTIVLLHKYLFRFIHFYTSYIIIIGGDNFFIVHILLNSRIRLFHVPFLVPVHAGSPDNKHPKAYYLFPVIKKRKNYWDIPTKNCTFASRK